MGGDEPPQDVSDLTVRIAHWHVNGWGGAEYLVTKLAEALDIDTVYTLGEPSPDTPNPYGPVRFESVVGGLSYSPLRSVQLRAGRTFEYAMWEDVDWRDYGDPDVVLTSGATTRAVITSDDTLHINYCHSPPRWFYDRYHDRKDSVAGQLVRPLVRYLRMRDTTIDARVDYYLANSPITARRLWKYYKRDGEVVYPPLDLNAYDDGGDEGFYLHLGRLDEEKGVPAIVEAFRTGDRRLVLAGGIGDIDREWKKRIRATDSIDFRGFVDEPTKYELLAGCRAVVFNGRNEDFGIVPVEANASGKACLARAEGFPRLYVRDGENGYLHTGSPASIRECIERFETSGIDGTPRQEAERFSMERFEAALESVITERYAELTTDCSTSELNIQRTTTYHD